jgi:hypothetical protein
VVQQQWARVLVTVKAYPPLHRPLRLDRSENGFKSMDLAVSRSFVESIPPIRTTVWAAITEPGRGLCGRGSLRSREALRRSGVGASRAPSWLCDWRDAGHRR